MENIVIQGRCRENGKLFRVNFTRQGSWYRVESVRGGTTVSAAMPDAPRLESGLARQTRPPESVRAMDGAEVSAWELDWEGSSCPHCGDGSEGGLAIIQCGACGGVLCGDGGQKQNTCHHCNTILVTGGFSFGRITTLKAQVAAPPVPGALALPPARGLLGSARRLLRRGKDR